jgi:hypothetical protein
MPPETTIGRLDYSLVKPSEKIAASHLRVILSVDKVARGEVYVCSSGGRGPSRRGAARALGRLRIRGYTRRGA